MLRRPDTPKLTVTNQTTLDQLRQFSDSAGANAKIRGKQNKDGSVTLYASTKKGTGLENKVQDDRGGKQATARYAVTMVLNRVKGANLDAAMANVKAQLPAQGELRGAGLAHLVQQAQTARQNAVDAPRGLDQLGAALDGALREGNAPALKHLTAELGKSLADYMNGKPADAQFAFVTSRGDAFKGQALGALASQLHDPTPLLESYRQGGPIKAVLDDAYQQATMRLPNRHIDDNTLSLNGTVYTKDRHLAAGGFGSVDVYKAASGEEIAVKTSIAASPEGRAAKFDEAAAEAKAHASAVAGGPANVVGLKGVVRTPEGGLQIALELASRGDAHAAIDKLNAAAARGDITPREANLARLTIVKDMVQGLRHVQETRGMTHLDVKAPNFFVDAGGVVKLGDFGTAKEGGVQRLLKNPVDNPIWTAPEVIKGGRERGALTTALDAASTAAKKAALADIDKTLSPADQDTARQNIVKKYAERAEKHTAAVAPFSITSKADTWSVGVDAYRLFTNEFPFDSGFLSEIGDKLIDFAADPAKRVRIPDTVDTGLSDADLGHLNALVGGLMHPDPQQRTTLSQALQNPLLQHPAVGSPEARAVIQRVTA